MGWFSKTPDESSLTAARLRGRSEEAFTRGRVERAIELGVKASRHEDEAERDEPWWKW
jgi:hypothetical protein